MGLKMPSYGNQMLLEGENFKKNVYALLTKIKNKQEEITIASQISFKIKLYKTTLNKIDKKSPIMKYGREMDFWVILLLIWLYF